MREIAFCFLVLLSALMTRPCFARGFSTVLPLQIGMPALIEEHHAVTTAKPAAGQWEPAPLPRAMAAPPIRRLTAGKSSILRGNFSPAVAAEPLITTQQPAPPSVLLGQLTRTPVWSDMAWPHRVKRWGGNA
ncbi:hypothetical protein [Asaia astilbis]|uniref:hypothetical protein n=1 Tax=Asaia astilbis TaxID=610244 RepID=UPI000471D06D|nr:hypothetical protein [Asaia astilbis]